MLDPAEEDLKVPAWLNDPTMYHNRGNTTFTGEDSQYGDFFGLDDLFTERPEVVDGMTDIYQSWIGEFGIDGFRIDTMKHVNDEFWQKFGPGILDYADRHGKPDFFMFGEVALDGSDAAAKSFTSHYTTHDGMQAILDFPFQDAARGFASKRLPTQRLADFFANDDWYTDADSNAYSLPTFLGNHDMGRFGYFVTTDNTTDGQTADAAELLARDRLGHELMYLSRGNPVVYYGDEQGFTGTGGDQLARQTMFASQVPEYQDDTQIGTDPHRRRRQLRDRPPALPLDRRPRRTHRALSGAARRRPAGPPGLRLGRPVRLLADRPAPAARVRRRAQQQRAAGLRRRADLPAQGRVLAPVRHRSGAPDHRRRQHSAGDRARTVDRRLCNFWPGAVATCAIADRLHLSVKTIETHRAHIKEKLGFPDAEAMVKFATEWVAAAED